MVIAFQILLLVIILISFFYMIGEIEKSKETTRQVTAVCLASIIAFIISVIWL